jgi:hypothetical protein
MPKQIAMVSIDLPTPNSCSNHQTRQRQCRLAARASSQFRLNHRGAVYGHVIVTASAELSPSFQHFPLHPRVSTNQHHRKAAITCFLWELLLSCANGLLSAAHRMLSQALKGATSSSSSTLLGSSSHQSLLDCSAQCSPSIATEALSLHVSVDDDSLDTPKYTKAQEQDEEDQEPFWSHTDSAEPSPFGQAHGLDALCRSFVASGLSHRSATAMTPLGIAISEDALNVSIQHPQTVLPSVPNCCATAH